jgi:hypothetical protein
MPKPSPVGWESIEDLLAKLSLEEKVSLSGTWQITVNGYTKGA